MTYSSVTKFMRDAMTGVTNAPESLRKNQVVVIPISPSGTLSRDLKVMDKKFDKIEKNLVKIITARPSAAQGASTPDKQKPEAQAFNRQPAAETDYTSGDAGGIGTLIGAGLAATAYAASKLVDSTESFYERLKDAGSIASNWFKKKYDQTVEAVTSTVTSGLEKITDMGSKLLEISKDGVSTGYNFVMNSISKVSDAVTSLYDTALGGVKSLWDYLTRANYDVDDDTANTNGDPKLAEDFWAKIFDSIGAWSNRVIKEIDNLIDLAKESMGLDTGRRLEVSQEVSGSAGVTASPSPETAAPSAASAAPAQAAPAQQQAPAKPNASAPATPNKPNTSAQPAQGTDASSEPAPSPSANSAPSAPTQPQAAPSASSPSASMPSAASPSTSAPSTPSLSASPTATQQKKQEPAQPAQSKNAQASTGAELPEMTSKAQPETSQAKPQSGAASSAPSAQATSPNTGTNAPVANAATPSTPSTATPNAAPTATQRNTQAPNVEANPAEPVRETQPAPLPITKSDARSTPEPLTSTTPSASTSNDTPSARAQQDAPTKTEPQKVEARPETDAAPEPMSLPIQTETTPPAPVSDNSSGDSMPTQSVDYKRDARIEYLSKDIGMFVFDIGDYA